MGITYINAHQVGAGTFTDVVITDGLNVDSGTLFVDETNNRVGVGETSPEQPLHIKASNAFIKLEGVDAAGVEWTAGVEGEDNFIIRDDTGGQTRFKIDAAGTTTIDTAVVVNESGANVDFRVEGDTDENALFVKGSNNRVGVGTNNPSAKFGVTESSSGWAAMVVNGSSGNGLEINAGAGGHQYPFKIANHDGTEEHARFTGDGNLGLGNSDPLVKLDISHDYNAADFETQLDNNEGGGDVLKFGTGTTVVGQAFFLHTDGSWDAAQANDIDTGGQQLIAIALGTSPTSHGMLLRGFVRLAAANIEGTPNEGLPCYVSDTASKGVDFSAPSGSENYIRVLGHCVDLNGAGDALIYFNPSHDVIELA